VAVTVTGVMAEPDRSDWSPGLVTDTELVMVQVKEAESRSGVIGGVRVTEHVQAVVGVPLTVPWPVDREPGRQAGAV